MPALSTWATGSAHLLSEPNDMLSRKRKLIWVPVWPPRTPKQQQKEPLKELSWAVTLLHLKCYHRSTKLSQSSVCCNNKTTDKDGGKVPRKIQIHRKRFGKGYQERPFKEEGAVFLKPVLTEAEMCKPVAVLLREEPLSLWAGQLLPRSSEKGEDCRLPLYLVPCTKAKSKLGQTPNCKIYNSETTRGQSHFKTLV